MKLTNTITELILHAEGKALATSTKGSPHVVPVSTVKVVDDKILLVNYFMGKTLENILENPEVSLACWKGLSGYQIKGTVEYVTIGAVFNALKEYVAEVLPDRVVKGVLILTPEKVYDVSATASYPGAEIL